MPDETVRCSEGMLQGCRDGRAWAWRGVPYAAPPIGALRFRPPEPPIPWSGLRDATRFGPSCPQSPGFLNLGGRHGGRGSSEDCLVLNVWSPSPTGRRPVMVWIHGGAFKSGSGALYRGGPLAALGDIVVVTINYRLGVFGFVNFGEALGDTRIAGNLGLLDMIAALRWVKGNIAAFGGDPDRVTLAGESAGAIAAALLTMAEPAAPLFHQAILQSGTATLAHSRERSLTVARAYADHLRLGPDGADALLRLPVTDLLAAQKAVAERLAGTAPAAPWFDGALLPRSLEAARSGPVRPIPILLGANRDEIALFKILPRPRLLPTRRAALRDLVTRDCGPATAARVLGAYPDTPAGTKAFASDLCFVMPALHLAERQAAAGPTWLYRFDYPHPLLGACHALELLFLFPFPGLAAAALRGGFLTGLRSGLSERLRAAWTSFVRTGSPGEDWPPFTPERRATRLFGLQDRIVDDPMRARREAWEGQDVGVGR